MTTALGGPLQGVRIIELAGIGAAPYGCMMLADMGAEVVRIERSEHNRDTPRNSPLLRNRRSMILDLKSEAAKGVLLAMIERADVLVESFRPGTAERLGLGPDTCLQRNSRLIYARMTGWGQNGPLAHTAGHDLNYLALAGVLHQIGPLDGKPVVPLNLIADFGGGGLLLAFGVVCALMEARRTGRGQIVDAAMVDGALSFMAMFFGYRAAGQFDDRTGSHLLGGGAPYYNVYETADRRYLAVAAIEPQFYRNLLAGLGIDNERWRSAGYPALDAQTVQQWPSLLGELAAIFKTRTRDAWCEHFATVDACVTPVLSLAEAAQHPQNRARSSFIAVEGVEQNAPAPRFSVTAADHPHAPPHPGSDALQILSDWNVPESLVRQVQPAMGIGDAG
jgi:alpha-methylacyl-CoA racemase